MIAFVMGLVFVAVLFFALRRTGVDSPSRADYQVVLIDKATEWRVAAERLGATLTRDSRSWLRSAIVLRDDGLEIRMESPKPREGEAMKPTDRFVVTGPGLLPYGLRLEARNAFAANEVVAFRRSDVVTEVGRFDQWVTVLEQSASAGAVLDRETRELVLEGFSTRHVDRLEVENGEVVCERRHEPEDSSQIVDHFRWMQKLAKRLLDPGNETPGRLAANAASDPIEDVRLANLIALQREFPQKQITDEASRSSLTDPAPQLRLAAAAFLGADGFKTFSELAAANVGVGSDIRVEALRHLVHRAPRETVIPVLEVLLRDATSEVRREAIIACGTLKHTGAVPLLLARLDPNHAPLASAVARAFGELGDPRAEPALLTILGSSDADVATAAAEALGRLGSVATVQALLNRIDAGSTTGLLRAAARAAIAAIQARQIGADDGQLSLSDAGSPVGTLTIVDETKGGQVSLPEDAAPTVERDKEMTPEAEQ